MIISPFDTRTQIKWNDQCLGLHKKELDLQLFPVHENVRNSKTISTAMRVSCVQNLG